MSYDALLWYPEAYPKGQMFYGDSGYLGKDTFPLMKGDKDPSPKKGGGSEGNIGDLQRGLKKLGANIVDDGIFGSGTESALKAKGYPTKVDYDVFNKIITAGGGVPAAGGDKGQQVKDTVKNILGGVVDFWKSKQEAGAAEDTVREDVGSGDDGAGKSNMTLWIVVAVLIFLLITIGMVVYLRKPKAA